MSDAYFDAKRGLLNASVFSDAEVFEREREQIFARRWLFVCPAAWVAEPGAFAVSRMGSTPVLAWRGAGGPKVFINRCVASETALAGQDRGRAETLHCPCHGWPYAADGDGEAATPDEVARVEAYGGLLFACMDAAAPPLAESFGEFRFYLDLIAQTYAGGVEVCGEAPMRTKLAANWKLAAEAFSGDVYQEGALSRASHEVLGDPVLTQGSGVQAATATGAAVLVDSADGMAADQAAPGGWRVLSATLFPNLSYDGRGHALHVWHPRGPLETELYTYCLAGADETAAQREGRMRSCRLRFGPAGMETQDAASVWSSITRASRGLLACREPLNLQMGLGERRASNLPGVVASLISENNQRQFYDWWQSQLRRPPAGKAVSRPMRLFRQPPVSPPQPRGSGGA